MSGRVEGSATLVLGHLNECHYREDGRLHQTGLPSMRVHRDFVYVYDRGSDRLSVHFAAGTTRGPLMCHLRVLPPEEAKKLQPRHIPALSWRLQGMHLCGADTYQVTHYIAFDGTAVQSMEVVYEVRGPDKDYTSWATYTRAASVAEFN